MADISVNLFGMKFETPIWTASGTFGFGLEYENLTDLNRIGAICVKGLSATPRDGNPPPRIWETPSGMLNAIGLQNPGVEHFIEKIVPQLKKYKTKVVANIYGTTYEEYEAVAKALKGVDGVHLIEVNISCPNVKKGGLAFGTDTTEAAKITEIVKKATDKPVIIKLSPNVTDIVQIAKAVEAAGANGISAINTLVGMAIDIYTFKPKIKNVIGGLSGPAIKPVAVRMVYQIAKAVSIPVIGIGGIRCWEDAVEFIIAGAATVQVGTANFIDPNVAVKIANGINDYLEKKDFSSIKEIKGKIQI